MQFRLNGGPLKLFKRDRPTEETKTNGNSITPFQQLSVQAYGRPVMLRPSRNAIILNTELHPPERPRWRSERTVRSADVDEGGRRSSSRSTVDSDYHPNPVEGESQEGTLVTQDDSLPAYDGTLKRPPRYSELVRENTFRIGLNGDVGGGRSRIGEETDTETNTLNSMQTSERRSTDQDPFEVYLREISESQLRPEARPAQVQVRPQRTRRVRFADETSRRLGSENDGLPPLYNA